ncbi:hypothetical protein C0Q90_16360, partial [Lacticaseibacillus paracasei]
DRQLRMIQALSFVMVDTDRKVDDGNAFLFEQIGDPAVIPHLCDLIRTDPAGFFTERHENMGSNFRIF